MTISLFDCSVLAYLQTLDAVHGFLTRGQDHFLEHGPDLQEVVDLRIHPDMRPFSFQIHSLAWHACGTMEAMRSGVFTPAVDTPHYDYTGLIQRVAQATAQLRELTPEQVNSHEGERIAFVLGEMRLPFKIEHFVMSFSLPNLHFHATTAYDILRAQGVPLGKRDYLGRLRLDK